jgi:glycine cleavage system H protein
MPDELTFLMGKYPARLPADRLYARNHMWAAATDGRYRFGFTAYAVRLMQDVYFLDWCIDPGAVVVLKQQIGNIETSKAVSDLFAPTAGTLREFNGGLLKDPSAINVDSYGPGWLFEMDGDPAPLIGVEEYYRFLEAGWANTERILKGQINREED